MRKNIFVKKVILGTLTAAVLASATACKNIDLSNIADKSNFNIDNNNSVMFNSDYPIIENAETVSKTEIGEGVTKLDFNIAECEFKVMQSADNKCYIEAEKVGKLQYYIENATLYIRTMKTSIISLDELQGAKIVLYIPAEVEYETANLELGAGELRLMPLTMGELKINVGAGACYAEQLISNKIDANVGMGEVKVADMQVNELKAEVGMGNAEFNGVLNGNASMKCAMGNITAHFAGNEKDFNYKVDASLGTVNINGQKSSGANDKKAIDNGAAKTIEVECSLGNLEIICSEN